MYRSVGDRVLCGMQGAVAATHMVATFAAAGLPPGVINLVTGGISVEVSFAN